MGLSSNATARSAENDEGSSAEDDEGTRCAGVCSLLWGCLSVHAGPCHFSEMING